MIRSLGDFKKDDKDKKPKNTSYTGGEKSGMAVENPDDIDAIVEKARQGGRDHASSGAGGPPKSELKITLYSNGFQVDGGEFRAYDAPENK
jgi:UBX domain-containing protein 1